MKIDIRIVSIEKVYPITLQIPEFFEPYPLEEYQKRLQNVPHLILAAYHNDEIVGFKIGYEREKNAFYSWMGAILPDYRQKGIAKALAKAQEKWAKENGYQKINFKTKNKLRSMLLFAIKNDFNIIDVIPNEEIGEYRIVMEKDL